LGIALMNKNYFVSDTNYGWGPSSIGDYTDIGHWWIWFCGPNSTALLSALYSESGRRGAYSRLAADPGGENEIIMFKSCFPNSHLGGSPEAPPTTGNNPLRGQDSGSVHMTVGNAKGIYNDILAYFATRQDKLFIAITAPPLVANDTDPSHAADARAFNDWLVNDWLKTYPNNNVAVFDFYNILTSNGGNFYTNDVGSETGNHHRWWNGAVQHIQTVNYNMAAYASDQWDSHPTAAGNQKATSEYPDILNYYYQRWKGTPVSGPTANTGAATLVTSDSATLNGTVNPNGISATYYFEYGSTTSYGSTTTSVSAGSGTGDVSVSETVTGLSENTTYHYRITAANSEGTSYGNDQAFTTQGGGLWSEATDLEDGWKYLDWFGYFWVDETSPWIYHNEHGWAYAYGEDTASVFFWVLDTAAWVWTSDLYYPIIYNYANSAWETWD
ncbi:MAG: hypothetical protein SV775_07490, partial [Thermodesulfobacteriota bacterium]|nr:hypothetical protein [Thermodesulfobacteriota bacterium]